MNLLTKPRPAAPKLDLYELEDKYALMDLLPESLFAPVVTLPMGYPIPRTRGVLELRQALLEGQLPDQTLSWPPPALQKGLISALDQLGIARFCYQNEELTDKLLLDILTVLEEKNGEYLRQYQQLVARLTQQEQQKLEDQRDKKTHRKQKKPDRRQVSRKIVISPEVIQSIEQSAQLTCWESLIPGIGRYLDKEWHERISIWTELESVFRDIQLVVQLGYDLSRGVLQSHGWLNIVKLRELLETLPELKSVIRSLGRMQQVDGEPVVKTVLESVKRFAEETKEVRSPLVPMEMRGITRSDSISRMLPQEASLLTHPMLKKLWHAKRAEQALLSYAVEGVDLETDMKEIEEQQEVTKKGKDKKFEKGPVLVCLDTSGSMFGTPEQVAKALVLETLRVAGGERRDCYVYLFGSTHEVAELELSRDARGMDKLITFLSMSFGGGTDVQGPVEKALERCKEAQWRNADLLIVSDGEFSLNDSFLQKVKRRKKSHGMRVHGVQIGGYGSMMEKLCEPLHQFGDWGDLLPKY